MPLLGRSATAPKVGVKGFRGRKRRHDARHTEQATQRRCAARDAPAAAEGGALAAAEGGALASAAPWDPRAPGAPGVPVFSKAVFGARLAGALDALLAMQRADAAQIARCRRAAAAMPPTDTTTSAPQAPAHRRQAPLAPPQAQAFDVVDAAAPRPRLRAGGGLSPSARHGSIQ